MPVTMDELGFTPADVDRLAATVAAAKGSVFGAFRKLSTEDVKAIYRSAFAE